MYYTTMCNEQALFYRKKKTFYRPSLEWAFGLSNRSAKNTEIQLIDLHNNFTIISYQLLLIIIMMMFPFCIVLSSANT